MDSCDWLTGLITKSEEDPKVNSADQILFVDAIGLSVKSEEDPKVNSADQIILWIINVYKFQAVFPSA